MVFGSLLPTNKPLESTCWGCWYSVFFWGSLKSLEKISQSRNLKGFNLKFRKAKKTGWWQIFCSGEVFLDVARRFPLQAVRQVFLQWFLLETWRIFCKCESTVSLRTPYCNFGTVKLNSPTVYRLEGSCSYRCLGHFWWGFYRSDRWSGSGLIHIEIKQVNEVFHVFGMCWFMPCWPDLSTHGRWSISTAVDTLRSPMLLPSCELLLRCKFGRGPRAQQSWRKTWVFGAEGVF